MIKVAINGFGRIGRAFFKVAMENSDIDVVAVNDLTSNESLAYMLRYDSVYGKYDKSVEATDSKLVVDGKEIESLTEKDPMKLPWKDLGIDVVVESTGCFTEADKASMHFEAGAKRVVISAPGKGDVQTVLVRENDEQLGDNKLTCNASCTTNAVGPVAMVMGETPGVHKAIMTTIHAYTASQKVVDGSCEKDYRRGRAAAINMFPTTTGAAKATALALPDYEDTLDGISVCAPLAWGCLADFTFLAKKKTSVEEVNETFKEAAGSERWKDVLRVSEEPIVSADIIGDRCASIVDLEFTRVVDGDLVKVLAWYDNEMGYAYTLVEHVVKVGELI